MISHIPHDEVDRLWRRLGQHPLHLFRALLVLSDGSDLALEFSDVLIVCRHGDNCALAPRPAGPPVIWAHGVHALIRLKTFHILGDGGVRALQHVHGLALVHVSTGWEGVTHGALVLPMSLLSLWRKS